MYGDADLEEAGQDTANTGRRELIDDMQVLLA